MRRACRFLLGTVLVVTGLAQAQERLPRFEVASVRQNISGDDRAPIRMQPGGVFLATNVLLKELVALAFSVPRERVLGGPEWIDSARYDVNAKSPVEWQLRPPLEGPPTGLSEMLRSLLEERFRLKAHVEQRDLRLYELRLARADGTLGPGLRPSSSDCDAIMKAVRGGAPLPAREPGQAPPCSLMAGPVRTIAGGATMQQLAAHLTDRVERPVVDKTGLSGRYAYELRFTPAIMPAEAPPPGVPPIDPNGPSLFVALEEQLGLKLVSTTGPLDVVVVDSIERPTPN